jgi:hypothetical protein
MKSRRMRWAGHVARMGEKHIVFWLENLKERDHLEDLGIDGKVLEWILGKCGGEVCVDWIHLAQDRGPF